MSTRSLDLSLDDMQREDLALLLQHLSAFWREQLCSRDRGRVVPDNPTGPIDEILNGELPLDGQELDSLVSETRSLIAQFAVKASHPLFLGYVTPPSLDVGALGDAMASIINQNVAFAALSPLGANLETKVTSWLGEMIGLAEGRGGALTSGGSEANLFALAMGRRHCLGSAVEWYGNMAAQRVPRIYCSEQTHLSIDKAAVMLGFGRRAVKRLPVDQDHRIVLHELRRVIKEDQREETFVPAMIVGNAGTRLCCAFDDLGALCEVADEFGLWFHVDAAYGGFLLLADSYPRELDYLHKADSITMDPHKLLFVPFECGALLVRDRRVLAECFRLETSDYLELAPECGVENFADLGIQLGRSLKALKVWLTLRYVGLRRFGREYSRLLRLAQQLRSILVSAPDFEVLGPVQGTAVCFRWTGSAEHDMDDVNSAVRRQIILAGSAFVDEVVVSGRRGMRVCFTNYRTQTEHVERLVAEIRREARTQVGQRGWVSCATR